MNPKFILTILAFVALLAQGWAQEKTVTGTVTSADDGAPLIGVSILIKSTAVGTITDIDGRYQIKTTDDATLVFSYTGFQSQEMPVNGQSTIDVKMTSGVVLDGIVVTALGISREKKALGYSVQEVQGEEIAATQENNLINALQGKVAGVQINSSSGAPGAGASIVIRGLNSLNPTASNQPLFVIDGIPISNQTSAGNQLPSSGSNAVNSQEQSSFTNRAADINPADIESISILKGPSATALYGLRAANGVVLITTKKGQTEGKANVSLNTSFGWEEVNKQPELQTVFREGRHGRLRFNSDGSPLRFQTFGPKVYEGKTPTFDPVDDFFQTGTQVRNSLSIQGGNERATYFTSFSRLDHEGIIPFTEWDRTTVRLGGTIKVADPLTVSGSVGYTNSGGNKPHEGDKSIMSSLSYYTTSFDINDYLNPDGSQSDFSDGIIDNPRYLAEFSQLKDNVHRVNGYIGFNYQPATWFELDYKVGNDFYNDSRVRSIPAGTDLGSQSGGFIIEEQLNYRELTSNLYARFSKQLGGGFNSSLTVGHNITDIQFNSTNTRGEGFSLENFYDLSNTTNVFASKNASRQRLVGLFGILSLSYNNYLYLDITGRNDWSSTLPKENRSFFYPSVSLSWVLSEMATLPEPISFLKLRGSWAQVGKDAEPYQIGVFYAGASNFPFNGVNGFSLSTSAGDFNLKPETTTSTEFGLDLRMFHNRLGLDVTLYQQNSKDQIIPVPVSNATGFSRFITNAGEIENSGVELLLNATPIKTKNFNWGLSVNWSKVNSEVKSIKDGIDAIIFSDNRITNKLIEGGKVGDLFGWDFNRNDNGQLLIDDNGFPTLNYDTMILVGNAFPDWIGGLTNTLSYKGLSLSVLLEWRSGGDVYDTGYRNSLRNGILKETERGYEQVVFNGVREDGTPNDIPVEINGESLYRNGSRYNDSYENLLQDASWFRIRRVSLSYDIPTSLWGGKYISGAKVTLSGNNLFLNTPFKGFDPETNFFGSGSNVYGYTGLKTPATRSYFVSLALSF
ncbi:MAG: SusC/RagA family TonB-linked outer membrane protein [Saprospiraceae bacterium]|nr:MAG: SusC/RagA family TonB-linked outer membrane protein [Saprospiraceae bacterium]